MSLDAMTAIVTGAASGIGAATVEALQAAGATTACFDVALEHDPSQLHWQLDVTEDSAIADAVPAAAHRLGGLDVLVNVAGIGATGTVSDNPPAEWARVFDVNVTSIARLTSAALPYLRHSSHACIVNVASIAATAGLPNRALYSATKGAVLALTRAMAADMVSDQIRVNCVSPGTVDTPWVQRLLDESEHPSDLLDQLRRRQPMGRLATPREVAEGIVYLASPAASFITGVNLAIDGGMQDIRLPATARTADSGVHG